VLNFYYINAIILLQFLYWQLCNPVAPASNCFNFTGVPIAVTGFLCVFGSIVAACSVSVACTVSMLCDSSALALLIVTASLRQLIAVSRNDIRV